MAPLVALGGGWPSSADALPRLVPAAAARVDRGPAVVAIGAWRMGRVDLYINPHRHDFFTAASCCQTRRSSKCLPANPARLGQPRSRAPRGLGTLLRGVIVNAFIEKIVDECPGREMVREVDPVTGAVTNVDVPKRG